MYLKKIPEVQAAEVWTTMPDRFRHVGVRSEWADANRGGEPIDSFIEGPVFDRHGNLYITDIVFGRIFRINPQANWELIVQYDGEPNGMKFMSEDELLITDYKNGLMKLNLQTRQVSPFLTRRNSERFKGPNDLVFDSAGNLYFTDQGQTGMHDPSGCVYRLRPNGQLDLLIDNIPSPNGIVLSPDEKVLFIGVTRGNCIWRAPLLADGSVAKVGQFFTSYGPSGPDGLTMDQAGNLAIANPGLGYLWLLNHRAEPIAVWASPCGQSLTNMAYGDEDRQTLYCTESQTASILKIRMPHPGMSLHVPAR
ncbi:SMP-30/gluconolactonase/LRE family protein [Orrella sp. NBD-18]|uniref:SMP-30/gluconolactonase/LRE family protein n=1 Tax=Sheuella amnicola TaxID=2707330 RepID=A0A6B2R092_9BURK|nr:SMP-30/gluconolactonase/LRE family protein [Sheuella amnicola]NDY82994.1 SMP-30/gluconolactonase/LRE family protein [Sheuella amnicola]